MVLDRYFETIKKPDPPSKHELTQYIIALLCFVAVNLFGQYQQMFLILVQSYYYSFMFVNYYHGF